MLSPIMMLKTKEKQNGVVLKLLFARKLRNFCEKKRYASGSFLGYAYHVVPLLFVVIEIFSPEGRKLIPISVLLHVCAPPNVHNVPCPALGWRRYTGQPMAPGFC